MIDITKLTTITLETKILSTSLLNALSYFKDMDRVCEFSQTEAEKPAIEQLTSLRKELGEVLSRSMKDIGTELNDHYIELDLCLQLINHYANKVVRQDTIEAIVEDAIKDAERAIEDGNKLMTAFSGYVRGTENLIKRLKNLRIG